MKLSIVIICWNDLEVIRDCLRTIFAETTRTDFEVIVSDNGSTDGSIEFVREEYPRVRIVENGANLGFSRANNTGIPVATGEYILILNPDTLILDGALDKWVAWADGHPEAGAFGCRVLNPDGSNQQPARPFPTVWRYLVSALYLRSLGRVSDLFMSDSYVGWDADSERPVDWQMGACVMFRGDLLKDLGGFDPCFFYHFEEVDLCYRVWKSGHPILFYPGAEIIHLGGQSVGRFPIRFKLETFRNRYRFFYKHYGMGSARRVRWVSLLSLRIRQLGYGLLRRFRPSEALDNRMAMYRVTIDWNRRLDIVRFIETGEEPVTSYEPLAPAPDMLDEAARGSRIPK
jgi:GT2 family glycosyltransferase